MKHTRFIFLTFLLLMLLAPALAMAQQTYKLTVAVNPRMAATPSTTSETLAEGATIGLFTTANANFTFLRWTDDRGTTVSEEAAFNYTMPARDVTLTAQYEYDPANPANPEGADLIKDRDGYYLISSAEAWKAFAALVEKTPEANARMTADVDLGNDQTMIGTFKGIFDGQGHTLTVNYNNADGPAVPFLVLNDASIKNLRVAGIINGRLHSAGIVYNTVGTVSIENCVVSASITCTGDNATVGAHGGGIIGHGINATVAILGCLFDGSIHNGSTSFMYGDSWAAPFFGWCESTVGKSVKDCMENGTYENFQYTNLNFVTYGQQNIFSNTNVYHKKDWDQGHHAYSITSGQSGLVLDFGTPTAVYDVSGITAYETGLAVGGVRYAGNGETIRFKAKGTDGQQLTKVEANGTELTAGADGWFTLTLGATDYVITTSSMPVTKDITVKASNTDITEGETFQLTVTLAKAVEENTPVSIVSEHPKRFSHPQTIVMNAGQNTVTIDVKAVDDDMPDLDLSSAFTVYVPGYEKQEVLVLLKDNDLPALELTLTPDRVKEGDGPTAVTGTLRRTTNKDTKITVRLSDDAEGGLYLGQTSIELAKGVDEVHFRLGPVDNTLVDGDRTYTVTAAVWISSCSCSAKGQAAGSVSAALQVYDDDGPALSLASQQSMVKEGTTTVLTVSRNTQTDSPLTVTLSSNHDEALRYDHTVTIAAGKHEATCTVEAVKNDVADDSQTIVFTAQSEGFSPGTCWLMVTDQTLPDALITDFTASKNEEMVGGSVTMSITLRNDGVTPLPTELPVRIYRRGSSQPVAIVYTEDELQPGSETTLKRTVRMPMQTGMNVFYAVVNSDGKVKELSTANNMSGEVSVNVVAPFTATVATDKSTYRRGETVTLSGQLTGSSTADVKAEVYVISSGGARQTFSVTTDASGHFACQWTPYTQQMGRFTTGACYPGEAKTEAMATFDIYGLERVGTGYIACDVTIGEPYSGTIALRNPGELRLTDVKAAAGQTPEGCTVKTDVATAIDGRQTVELKYTITGTIATAKNEWEKIPLSVTTAEGVQLDLSLYYYCRPAKAQLVVSESSIKTTMTKGKVRDYLLTVTNIGKGSTGDVTLSLPDFMTSATGTTLPSLAQNDSAVVVLRLRPTDDMQLNVPVKGQLGVNSKNGGSVSVDYNITPVSEDKGTLTVDVCDEYTYYADGAPHVEGADVVLRNPVTQALVAKGTTGKDGLYTVSLPEGYYQLSVTANNHDAYRGNILVSPGAETKKTVDLSVRAIEFSFDVEETEVEDQYTIVTNVTYETNVPVPVVLLEGPKGIDGNGMQEGDEQLLVYTLINKGLINAQNVNLYLPVPGNGWEMEALSATGPFLLAPQQSVNVAVVIRKVAQPSGSRHPTRASASDDIKEATENGLLTFQRCTSSMVYEYEHICGESIKKNTGVETFVVGTCMAGGIFDALSTLVLNLGLDKLAYFAQPGPPNNPGDDKDKEATKESNDIGPETSSNVTFCDPKDVECAQKLIEAMLAKGEGFGAAGLSGLNNFAKMTQQYRDDREKAKEDGKEPDEVDKKFIMDQLKDGMEDIGDVVQEAMNELNGLGALNAANAVGGYAEELWGIVNACKYTYNKLHPKKNAKARATAATAAADERDKWETLEATCLYYDNVDRMAQELFGSEKWMENIDSDMTAFLKYLNAADLDATTAEDLYAHAPEVITLADCQRLRQRLIATADMMETGLAPADGNYICLDTLFACSARMDSIDGIARQYGFETMNDMFLVDYADYLDYYSKPSEHVCAKVKLQFSQSMALTRQAFRGTLTVFNGHEDTAMTDVKLTMLVTNEDGEVATPHEFQINAETLTGFGGELSLDSGWSLDAQQTGVSTILFIPTKYAAPEEPAKWSFGGVLSYVDPFTGAEVRRELTPVTLTVSPSPQLELTYLMQRDIFGDDPLTEDVVEPMVPSEFALIINNKGEGEARNVRMTTEQPQITENEKGLAVEFEIVSSQVNGEPAALAFGQTIANDFGTIAAHEQSYAQWWLQSSLLGHFTDYDVSVNHVTSYGNPDLSLVDTVTIHEMVHGFTPVHNSQSTVHSVKRGWLVNDRADANDVPDAVYFADATQQPLYIATATMAVSGDKEYSLRATAEQRGWNYGSLSDPTNGQGEIVKIVRQSDGAEVPLDNVWRTDRTLRDGKDWLYENRLHFVGEMAAGSETFVLTVDSIPAEEPEPEPEPEPTPDIYLTVNAAGYATFYDSQTAYELPVELKAGVVSEATNDKLIYTFFAGRVVPKDTPVMIESKEKRAGTYKLTGSDVVTAYNGTNLLRGSDVATMATPGSGEQLYKLAYGPSGTKWSNVFGWYWGAEGGGAFQIEGHKAWLAVPAASGARLSGYDIGGEALDIEGMAGEAGGDTIFDLQGRRVNNSRFTVHNSQLRKGIYVRNGQKVIIK